MKKRWERDISAVPFFILSSLFHGRRESLISLTVEPIEILVQSREIGGFFEINITFSERKPENCGILIAKLYVLCGHFFSKKHCK